MQALNTFRNTRKPNKSGSENRREEQGEIDFAWENDMLDDLSEHY